MEAAALTNEDQILAYQLFATWKALTFQAKTGLKISRTNVLKFAKQRYGVKGRTAGQVADALKAKFPQVLSR